MDVGCGCGEQDFYWKEQYPELQINAMDLTPLHIEVASKRCAAEQVDICFQVSNACELPFADESFNRVAALDYAYHFDPWLFAAFRHVGDKAGVSEFPEKGKPV